jgi:predicted O-methyltransferase YrrM
VQDRIDRFGLEAYPRRNYDYVALARYKAGVEAAEFYTKNMLTAQEFDSREELYRHCVGMAKTDGLFLEFGVATGTTITMIANCRTGRVFGFDSFEGLPEDWYGAYQKGTFAQDQLPTVPSNVTLVKGWFSDTLPGFLRENPGAVSFVHIDSDLYSSATFIFEQLRDRIHAGTVILFDEFFNYPGWQEHEYRAFMEFVEANGIKFRYDSFLRANQPVCVVIE